MEHLLYISMILLLGTIFTFIAKRLKVSSIFFLVLLGLVLGSLDLVDLPIDLLTALSTITLVIVVFDSVATFKMTDFVKLSFPALRFVVIFFVMNLVIMTLATKYLLGYFSISIGFLAAAAFSALMFGIDETISLTVLGNTKSKVAKILEIEAVANSPFTIIVPLLLLSLIDTNFSILATILQFCLSIIVPILIGLAIGYFTVFFLRYEHFQDMAYLLILASTIISYVLSGLFGYSGVFAVCSFAYIFGHSKVLEKEKVEKQAAVIGQLLIILVFIMLGSLIASESKTRSAEQLIAGTILFLIYLIARYVAVYSSFPGFNLKERLFMTFSVPKGVDVAVVILLIMVNYSGPEIMIVKNLALLFVLYSIVLGTITASFGKWFLE
jgi:NhaP-type Na+/H+ or K+/H+ antiporter